MNKSLYILIFCFSLFMSDSVYSQNNFKTEQQAFSRVKQAYSDKESVVKKYFSEKNIEYNGFNLFIRVFKQEALLEVWVKEKNKETYMQLTNYSICSSSGELGPKRKQGDYQVPEGFYFIEKFNPYSNFYLSLGINYPNASDKIKGEKGNLGGDIFIHGSCVTIGCMPLTDDKIKEVYILAVEAKNNGQAKIPVHIFPFKMTENNLKPFADKTDLFNFWNNLKEGYDYFDQNLKIPNINVDSKGNYLLKK